MATKSRISLARRPAGVHPIEHTADLGFEVEAASLEECFARMAVALFQSFMPRRPPSGAQQIRAEVEASGAGLEELLVAWLEELLYLSEVRRLVFQTIEVSAVNHVKVIGRITGWHAAQGTRYIGPALKGITRHGLSLEHIGSVWRARLFVDV
jgi:SHS2 domain-containing protein